MYSLWITTVLWIIATTKGELDQTLTLQNVWGRLQTDMRSIIQCQSDDSYKKVKFSRMLDTGQGAKLPKSSQQFQQAKPVSARILFMPGEDKSTRFGIFQCKSSKSNVETGIVTMKLPPYDLMELDAFSPYITANVGDDVVLEINVTKKMELTIKWRHNGIEVPDWDGLTKVDITDVQVANGGVYESYYEGRRNEGLHALMRLIVRSCPSDLYGKDCDKECPPCYNGGICHDKWGSCVCPAGFSGDNCETACGGNHFGPDCSKFCSPPTNTSNTDELCTFHLFCKPDPYGCSCAPGFKGSKCMEHCEPGWYGADCKQPCHCAYGISNCNRITGACDGGCAKGWRGNSCQIEDPNSNNTYIETTTMASCNPGAYGPSCERQCHCAGNEHCHIVTGHCPSGCEDGWAGLTCGVQMPDAAAFISDDDFIEQIERLKHNISDLWENFNALKSVLTETLNHLRIHQSELEETVHMLEHKHDGSDSSHGSYTDDHHHHHSGEQQSHGDDHSHGQNGHSHSDDDHSHHSGEHHSHSGEQHSHGDDHSHGGGHHSGESHSHGDDHDHHSHSHSHSDSHEKSDNLQQSQQEASKIEPLVMPTSVQQHHHQQQPQLAMPNSLQLINDSTFNRPHHHHHHHHHSHGKSERNRTVDIPKFSEVGVYDFAICNVQPNRALPDEQQQPIIGRINLWQKKSGGPLNIHIRLQGFDVGDHGHHGTHQSSQQQVEDQEVDNETPVTVGHKHGFHIHALGDLSNGCQSAGPHFNPKGVNHGGPNALIRHVGDLGNIECDEHGNANIIFNDDIASLRGAYSIIGKSLVIHADTDDFGLGGNDESLRTGNAGTRLACCVIEKVDKLPIRTYKFIKAATPYYNG